MSKMDDEVQNSPLGWALNIVGDRWSLLALHQIGQGVRRFNDIQRHTGIPRDRLASRLRRLTTWAVIARRQYCDHPPRFEYALTEAGESLAPALDALEAWGERHSCAFHGVRTDRRRADVRRTAAGATDYKKFQQEREGPRITSAEESAAAGCRDNPVVAARATQPA